MSAAITRRSNSSQLPRQAARTNTWQSGTLYCTHHTHLRWRPVLGWGDHQGRPPAPPIRPSKRPLWNVKNVYQIISMISYHTYWQNIPAQYILLLKSPGSNMSSLQLGCNKTLRDWSEMLDWNHACKVSATVVIKLNLGCLLCELLVVFVSMKVLSTSFLLYDCCARNCQF
jgi:hypothetical protein